MDAALADRFLAHAPATGGARRPLARRQPLVPGFVPLGFEVLRWTDWCEFESLESLHHNEFDMLVAAGAQVDSCGMIPDPDHALAAARQAGEGWDPWLLVAYA